MDDRTFGAEFAALRGELTSFLMRMVLRPALAEDLVQEAATRALAARDRLPPVGELRPWLFRIAINLALDYLRQRKRGTDTLLLDLRNAAEADEQFVRSAQALVGQPEMRAVAREHLIACFACVLQALAPEKAAALLLIEVHGFTVEEAASLLDARPAQAKNWLQDARKHMLSHYGESCALISKRGVCHQCAELSGFFAAEPPPELSKPTHYDTRIELLRKYRSAPAGTWQQHLFSLLDELA